MPSRGGPGGELRPYVRESERLFTVQAPDLQVPVSEHRYRQAIDQATPSGAGSAGEPTAYVRESERLFTVQAPDLEVPVSEHRYRQVIDHRPVVQEQPVVQDVEVCHRVLKEIPQFSHVHVEEEVVREVPRTIIREVIKTQETVVHERDVREVEVPISVAGPRFDIVSPRFEALQPRIVEVSNVRPDVYLAEEVVEIPCIVDVPQLNVIENTSTEETRVPVEVTHRHIIEKPVVVEQEKVETRVVEVPTKITERHVHQKPVFVPAPVEDLLRDGYRVAEAIDAEFHKELQTLTLEIDQLERERSQLSTDLGVSVKYINDLREALMIEERTKATLKIQVETAEQILLSLPTASPGAPLRGGSPARHRLGKQESASPGRREPDSQASVDTLSVAGSTDASPVSSRAL